MKTKEIKADKKIQLAGLGEISYYSKKNFWKLHSRHHGGYHVIGAVGSGVDKEAGTTVIEGQEVPYCERK